MSNYTKTTDFEAKDSLPTGDSGKIIRGAEFETEFDAISTAIATKADTAGPTFTGTLTFETISDGTIGVTAFVDEDDMVSNSATLVPTQQSVKAYVDSQVTAQDLDFQADTGGALSIDLDSESLTFTGGTGIDTSGLGNAVTFAIDSTVATLTGTQTLTNKTLTSPDVNTPDIDGGTIDGTVIGGTTAAAGSFTTVSATGNITVGGTVDGRDVATDGTKLDGIESGATADQTAAEIRTLVEAATDSNVFTDADHTKLDGIEALADVTDTTNVTAAGAVMDSELTNITAVKALDQGVATTDTPTFAGLTTTADVSFGDNDKAVFGAGSDLQIYHDGSNSYIEDTATGSLFVKGSDLYLQDAAGFTYLRALDGGTGGTVTLFHDGLAKLATTSSGIDVTGIVTVGNSNIGSNTSHLANMTINNNGYIGSAADTTAIQITTAGNVNFTGGDISFYEDTGTTAKFAWDAADETISIGLGASSTATISAYSRTVSANLPSALRIIENTGASTYWDIGANNGSSPNLNFYVNANTTPKVTFASSGNVGIGTSSPEETLSVMGDFQVALNTSVTGRGLKVSTSNTSITDDTVSINAQASTGILRFQTNSTERIRVDSSGAVLIHPNNATRGLKITSTTTGTAGDTTTYDTIAAGFGRHVFKTDGTERVRIDQSGNLLVGNTVTNPSSNSSNQRGFAYINSTGKVEIATTANDVVMDIGKNNTNDGSLVAFRKEGTVVGTIGTASSYLTIGSPVGSGGHLLIGNNLVHPATSTGASKDASIDIGGSSNRFKDLYLSGNITMGSSAQINASNAFYLDSDIIHFRRNNETESARIDSSGTLLVGKTSGAISDNGHQIFGTGQHYYYSTATEVQRYYETTTQNQVGSISITTSATTYNTSSDQRLKDNIVDAPSASDDIDAIQVRSFDWKADGSHQKYGMVAQELQSVAPEAVTGDADSDDMMGVDYSKLVPMMLKEIQSLRARVAQLEGVN